MWYASLYVLLCLIAGVLGRHTRMGIWGVAAMSLVITPLVSLLILLLYSPKMKSPSECP